MTSVVKPIEEKEATFAGVCENKILRTIFGMAQIFYYVYYAWLLHWYRSESTSSAMMYQVLWKSIG
jgi:hypothetical protein